MITAINNSNATKYKLLFAEAENYLLGYESVTVFDPAITYYLKDEVNNVFKVLDFGEATNDEKITIFFDILNSNPPRKIYKEHNRQIVDEDGKEYNSIVGITSLEEYFHWLPLIKSTIEIDAEGKEVEKPTKFVILPLDEEPFKIDANRRSITIPDNFKKNGIAVQSDELAEVVYFKVDRFFDAMDLNNCEIYIQWETPKRNDGLPTKGISPAFIRDIESEPGQLIFGWAISEAITKFAGNLKFSVKFFQLQETPVKDDLGVEKVIQNVVYSLNTLIASVEVKPGIGIDLSKENEYIKEEDSVSLFMDRIQPSVVVGAGQAQPPKFLDYPYMVEGLSGDGSGDILEEDGEVSIYALAYSIDTGVISYDWRRINLDSNNNETETAQTVKYTSEKTFVKSEFTSREEIAKQKHRIFWYYPEGEDELEELGSGEMVVGAFPEGTDIPELFERKAVFVVDKPGIYKVRAKNRIHNSLNTLMGEKSIIFKRPDPVVMEF